DKLATTAAVSGTTNDIAGQFGDPHWTVFGTVRYQGERLGTVLDLRWYEGGAINNQLVEGEISRDGVNSNRVKATVFTNVTLDYDFSREKDGRMQLFFRVSSLMTTYPPFPV